MNSYPLPRPWRPEPLSEAAAAWVLMQEEGELSETNQRSFADWLAEGEAHVAAYEDALWALDAAARHAGAPEMLALRHAALAARGSRKQIWSWTGGLGLVAASAVAAIALWSAPIDQNFPMGTATSVAEKTVDPAISNYQTGIGQRSAINLPDGSVATLDTDSEIRVAYSDKERAVYLLKGQALFEVAHGNPMPFQVYAKGQRITAVGTIFNVRIEGDEVRVSMVEGTVKVRPRPGGDPSIPIREVTLNAGEAIVAAPASPLVVKAVEVREVASWKGGVLVFNDVPLSEAVAEINRYTTRPIAIADGAVGKYRVSGVFKSNDPLHFSRAMADVFPIEVSLAPDGAPTLRARGD